MKPEIKTVHKEVWEPLDSPRLLCNERVSRAYFIGERTTKDTLVTCIECLKIIFTNLRDRDKKRYSDIYKKKLGL